MTTNERAVGVTRIDQSPNPQMDNRSGWVQEMFWKSLMKYAGQEGPSASTLTDGASLPHAEHDFDAELGMFWYNARGKPLP